MPYFLGIDGGASKTSCVIGDERNLLGRGQGGSSNLIRVGEPSAAQSLKTAILEACSEAGISPLHLANTCVGAAGSDREEVRSAIHRTVASYVGGDVHVVGDMVLALEAAFEDGVGIAVIAGSGSIAYGRNSNNQTARAGGWGHAVSDEGSGFWIGRRAVCEALRALDNGSDKGANLLSELMAALVVASLEQLILKVNSSPTPDFAALVPAVIKASATDQISQRVLKQAGEELSELALIVLRMLFQGVAGVRVAMSGGVFANSQIVRDVFYNSLLSKQQGIMPQASVVEPVMGALKLARKQQRPQVT